MPVGNFTITDRDKSPPYMNSEPEVIHRKLHNDSGESLKFLILGVDGVFDRVTSEEATLLMAAYLEHKNHPPIAKTDLPSKLALTEPPTERPWPSEPLPGTVGRDIGKWVFANDENAATHMIRNSLPGHGDAEVHRIALSLRENTARQFRDDMTAVVLFFGDESSPLTSNEATTGGPV
ncbi:hypothetical protein JCM24511_02282 [Saitozyma sp. JCM 24511]|nr:hypothetical protein JCM24511_02282 [Saitozyma sp. JCM 24511]